MWVYKRILVAVLPAMVACSEAPPGACPSEFAAGAACVGHLRQEGRSWQGRSWQGRSWQGRSWQGTGTAVSTVAGIRIGGAPVTELALSGTVITGLLDGQPVAGTDFLGAVVTQTDVDGTRFESTITSVEVDAQDPTGELLLYTLTATNPDTGAVENLCAPDPFGGRAAIPVYGSWDATGAHATSGSQFMFGCTSGVVSKCIRWGYKPWKTVNGISLADYHQSCTRMARADYCGDGVSHTVDGTLIDLYDDLGIQVKSAFELGSPLVFDAAWTTEGAWCMAKDRWLKLSTLPTVTLACKLKFLSLSPLLAASPVEASDLCLVKRSDVPRSSVHLDNRSGLNISLN